MMKTVHIFGLLLCWSVLHGLPERFLGMPVQVTLTRTDSSPSGETTSPGSVPERMDYLLQLEGRDILYVQLVRQRFMGLPSVAVAGSEGNMEDKAAELNDDIAFYIDVMNGGSFSCQLASDGQCIMGALFDNDADICYISPGSGVADCFPRTMHDARTESDGIELNSDDYMVDDERTSAGRIVVDLAVAVDLSVMTMFDARHRGDSVAVRRELQIYTALLANKMNVELSYVREVTYGEMEIVVYPAVLLCPEVSLGERLTFQTASTMELPRRDKLMQKIKLITDTLDRKSTDMPAANYFVQTIVLHTGNKEADVPTEAEAEGQICEPTGVVSSVRFRDAVPDATRAVKTALGVDDDTIDLEVEDVLNTLSGCRVVNGYTDDQFRDLYCEGELQLEDSSLDKQCQHHTGWAGSMACDDTSTTVCSQHRAIRCRTSSGACNASLPLVWNGTPCGLNKVCYHEHCISTNSVCTDDLTASQYGMIPQPMCTADSPCARSARDVGDVVSRAKKVKCSCCCFSKQVRNRRNRCCRLGRKAEKQDCYCCGQLRNTNAPVNFNGEIY